MTESPKQTHNVPILCLTDSIVQSQTDTDTVTNQTVHSNDIMIPDDSERLCIETNNSSNNSNIKSIEHIIKNIDKTKESSDNSSEYVTKEKFTTLFGDMRNDILSMVNLIGVLNKNVTNINDELHVIKKNVTQLTSENKMLKDKTITLEHTQNEMSSMISTNDENKSDKKSDNSHKPSKSSSSSNNHTDSTVSSSNKNNSSTGTKNTATNSDEDATADDNARKNYVDSHMDKKKSNLKVVPNRTRKNNADKFGKSNDKDEQTGIVATTSKNTFRRETTESGRKLADTRSIRASRLGLNNIDKSNRN